MHTGFPWCRCSDYLSTSSPYTLTKTSENVVSGNLETVFALGTVPPKSGASDCFQALSQGLSKIQIATSE